jgi:hypothetical protein
MPNQETYPSSLFPLRGDISAESGDVIVEVVGLQNIPIAPNPLTDGAVPTYVAANGDIEWLPGGGNENNTIEINGVGVSDDYLILCDTALVINFGSDTFLGVRVNGVLVGN